MDLFFKFFNLIERLPEGILTKADVAHLAQHHLMPHYHAVALKEANAKASPVLPTPMPGVLAADVAALKQAQTLPPDQVALLTNAAVVNHAGPYTESQQAFIAKYHPELLGLGTVPPQVNQAAPAPPAAFHSHPIIGGQGV